MMALASPGQCAVVIAMWATTASVIAVWRYRPPTKKT